MVESDGNLSMCGAKKQDYIRQDQIHCLADTININWMKYGKQQHIDHAWAKKVRMRILLLYEKSNRNVRQFTNKKMLLTSGYA